MDAASVKAFLKAAVARDPHQPEYLQAVREVTESLAPFLRKHPEYDGQGLLERLVEPERLIQFRVAWVDDRGQTRVNRAFRVQHSSALGPYKGGMRFHPSVNLSILKFLAFEQTLKNALTGLPMGGGKGGSDFDPKGKSEVEIMRFCQALLLELYRHVGDDTDVPAGDIGVGGREIGYMVGMLKKLSNRTTGTFTGKPVILGGSLMRPEATGYGVVYFAEEMLQRRGASLQGLRVALSGAGNVALYAAEKALESGARVVTVSDSGGTLFFREGMHAEQLLELMVLKFERRGRLEEFARKHKGSEFLAGKKPWQVPVDVALPCATQNELDGKDAAALVRNGVRCVLEGANMPCTPEAVDTFTKAKIPFVPGKASNAGGVAVSGLEMSQNAQRLAWPATEVDNRLHVIMKDIHQACVMHGERRGGYVEYVVGANIAGFVRVADALRAQGIC